DIDGVIKRANKTEFGLAAGVFSKDVSKVMRIADRLQAGTVFINTYQKTDVAAPFGGFKQSGFGKDLGNARLILVQPIFQVNQEKCCNKDQFQNASAATLKNAMKKE
ncbi:hypothetical protein TELCIR_20492, partial [Teladorsagia circumcincta]